jgi:DNA polymerase I-like protein with 3'-5' exonuclease and polymerase domains
MILQIHDELVFDIPVSEREIFGNMVREVMEGVLQYSELRTQN